MKKKNSFNSKRGKPRLEELRSLITQNQLLAQQSQNPAPECSFRSFQNRSTFGISWEGKSKRHRVNFRTVAKKWWETLASPSAQWLLLGIESQLVQEGILQLSRSCFPCLWPGWLLELPLFMQWVSQETKGQEHSSMGCQDERRLSFPSNRYLHLKWKQP